jgi:hypothetical protein
MFGWQGIDFLYTAVALRGTYVEAYYNLGTSAYQALPSCCYRLPFVFNNPAGWPSS